MEKKKCKQSAIRCQLSGFLKRLNAERRTLNAVLLNEKGIALVIVMVLSAIGLALMAGLVYMLTSGTQISGIQKRYKTALEAGTGGADVTLQLIGKRTASSFTTALAILSPSITTSTGCTSTKTTTTTILQDGTTTTTTITNTYTGLDAKLNMPTATETIAGNPTIAYTGWIGCDTSLSINPAAATSYDMKFDVGASPAYTVYAKISDTVLGNSAEDTGLIKNGVVATNTGEVTVMSIPYLYTIEIDSENAANPAERAKLSVLYQY